MKYSKVHQPENYPEQMRKIPAEFCDRFKRSQWCDQQKIEKPNRNYDRGNFHHLFVSNFCFHTHSTKPQNVETDKNSEQHKS